MDEFTSRGLYVGSVCITQYSGQESADLFKKRLEKLGIRVYKLYLIPGYPSNTSFIVSDEGYGKNDYIETTRPLVVITAPDLEAERWQPAFLSSIMNINVA